VEIAIQASRQRLKPRCLSAQHGTGNLQIVRVFWPVGSCPRGGNSGSHQSVAS
jgi:hypothetical protein